MEREGGGSRKYFTTGGVSVVRLHSLILGRALAANPQLHDPDLTPLMNLTSDQEQFITKVSPLSPLPLAVAC
jgi:hypothetical protein